MRHQICQSLQSNSSESFCQQVHRYINPIHLSCSAKAIASKIALDQIVMSPIGTTLFYLVTSVLQGETSQVPSKLKEKFVPTLIASYTLWPAAHAINFKFVPSQQRILYTNIVSVSTSTFLEWSLYSLFDRRLCSNACCIVWSLVC